MHQAALAGPSVNLAASNNYATQAASKNRHAAAVQLLLQDPRVDPAVGDNNSMYNASKNGHSETMSVLLEDPRVILTTDDSQEFIHTAIQNGFVDVVAILLVHFPLADVHIAELIGLCAAHGGSEILKVVLQHMQPQENEVQLTTTVRESLQSALKNGHHQFVLELVTQSADLGIAQIVAPLLNENGNALFAQLACMRVDVLRVLLRKFGSGLENKVSRKMISSACRTGSADVVQQLLDNHQDKFGDWRVDDCNAAAMCRYDITSN
jgi:ankyrin repeat protein